MILNKPQLVENIVNEISDNSTGQISPYDIRHNLLDVVDSVHNLLDGKSINTNNFATPATRSTKAGDFTLNNLNLNGYNSVDNSAFGYESLKSNYQGSRNTALGSQSLSCNIHGDDNAAVGFQSLGGNTNGVGNVGLGSYSLTSNKVGSFNIAIGHAAGYYADRYTCNKLFIASHPVDHEYICDNPTGSGLTPLVYGDLLTNQFGINVNNLDSSGTLQVGGDITPSSGSAYSVGSNNYRWNAIFVDTVNLPSGQSLTASSGRIISSTSIVPESSGAFNIGSPTSTWANGYFDNITVNGVATFNRFNAYENCEYACKTIYLASSGSVEIIDGGGPYSVYDYAYNSPLVYSCNLLTDEQMSGAGFVASTSGVGYRRDYKFLFSPPSAGFSCDTNGYARASWFSNITIALDSGVYLKTNRIVSYDSNCHGLYFDDGRTYIGRKNILDANPSSTNGNIAGVGNTNFFANSGVVSDYVTTIAALESGVSVSTRLLTGAKRRVKDALNNNKDRLNGFEIKFIDTALQNISIPSDRLVIGSYNDTSTMFNTATLMKNGNQGIFGINNLGILSENLVPNTSLDIRTTGNAIIRLTAENQNQTVSALQLLGEQSCEYKGVELAYRNTSGVADLSIFKDSARQVFIRMYDTNNIGMFTSNGTANAMLTIGDSFRNTAAVSLREHISSPSSTTSYGKIFVKSKPASSQSQSLFFIDSSGNQFDLVSNKFDPVNGSLYTDSLGNTFGGRYSPTLRTNIVSRANTFVGYGAGSSLGNGVGSFNSIFGYQSGSGIQTGSGNIIIGSDSAKNLINGSNNIVLGNNVFNSSNRTNNIIIGNDGLASGITNDYQFYLGASRSSVLLYGTLGPTNSSKQLSMPSGGKLNIFDNYNTDALSLQANTIEIRDFGGNNYPDNPLTFKFTGNQSVDLLRLKHHVSPLTNAGNYDQTSNNRPHAELRGDLRLLGSIRFSDGTSLDSSNQLQIINAEIDELNTGVSNINNRVNSLIVEGTVSRKILAPTDSSQPTSGNLIIRNSQWQDIATTTIVNRDKGLTIEADSYVIAIKINNEYRPIWVSSQNVTCSNC